MQTGGQPVRAVRLARRALRILVVLLAATACDDAMTGTGDTTILLRVVAAEGSVLGNVDQGRIRIIGPTSRTVTVSPGTTQTIDGLAPGSYTVALEGLTGGDVETFGVRSGVNVVAGSNTTVTVTMNSFVPVIGAPPADVQAGQSATVTFSAVSGATVYVVEYAANSAFTGAQQTEVSGTTANVMLSAEGVYYIRVRARNEFGSLGVPSASVTVTAGPEIEPLSDYIAFTANHTGQDQVYVVPSSGGPSIQLTTTVGGAPDISPDGTRIVYQEGQQLAMMNADGSGRTLLPGSGCYPDWSPDGTEIVFAEFCVLGHINISNADGSNRRPITATGTGYEDLHPRWSPDASRIVFESNRTGNRDIWIMNADGSNLQQITDDPGADGWPAFSPDGSKISWERSDNGQTDLWTMNPDGSWKSQVTNDAAHDGRPDWSPGREWLALLRDGEIYRYRPDGSGAVRLTDTGASASNSLQRWGPCLDASCAPTTGQIEATVRTSGAGVDPNGYVVSVDGGPGRTLNGNDLATFVEATPGGHTVSISGIAPNCTLDGPSSVSVNVTAGQLAQAPTFDIDCVQIVTNEIVITPSVVNFGFVGATMTIYGTPFDDNGDPIPTFVQIFFTPSNPAVATVDLDGRITATGVGSTTITVTDGFGRSGSIEVNVSGGFGPVTYSGGHAYAATNDAMTWSAAQALARDNGGHLVAINDAQENGFLTNTYHGPVGERLWIGLYDNLLAEDIWVWTDLSAPPPGAATPGSGFAAWAPGEPNNASDDEHCVEFAEGLPGLWNDVHCEEHFRGIAEWPFTGPNVIQGVAYHNGHRYTVTGGNMTWIEARNLAWSLGGNLVVIDDAAENEFLANRFGVPLDDTFWIGLNDYTDEGNFRWIDGSPLIYTNWRAGEPNNGGGIEHCAVTDLVVAGNMTWNDVDCGAPYRAIIEWNSLK
jgi:TolB protein